MNQVYFRITRRLLMSIGLLYSLNAYAEVCGPQPQNPDIFQAIKWYRSSAEQKALYNQAFSVGYSFIDNWVKTNKAKPHTWGVIMDIDETILDNSWYFKQCHNLARNQNDFSHYVAIPAKSVAIPGSAKTTCAIQKAGGYVSLISNRDGAYRDKTGDVISATIKNLKQQGLCFDQILFANDKQAADLTDKNPRFKAVSSGKYDATQMVWSAKLPAHKVVAYFGDNIQDFPKFKQIDMYNASGNAQEFDIFGHGYFIMPNPMYGSWDMDQHN